MISRKESASERRIEIGSYHRFWPGAPPSFDRHFAVFAELTELVDKILGKHPAELVGIGRYLVSAIGVKGREIPILFVKKRTKTLCPAVGLRPVRL